MGSLWKKILTKNLTFSPPIWQTMLISCPLLCVSSRPSWECVRRERGRLWVEAIRSINAELCQVSSISSGQSAIRFLFTLNSWERVRRGKKNMAHGGRGLWSQSGHTGNLFPKVLISKKRVTFTRRSIAAGDTNTILQQKKTGICITQASDEYIRHEQVAD